MTTTIWTTTLLLYKARGRAFSEGRGNVTAPSLLRALFRTESWIGQGHVSKGNPQKRDQPLLSYAEVK